jgi:hypothetical protein
VQRKLKIEEEQRQDQVRQEQIYQDHLEKMRQKEALKRSRQEDLARHQRQKRELHQKRKRFNEEVLDHNRMYAFQQTMNEKNYRDVYTTASLTASSIGKLSSMRTRGRSSCRGTGSRIRGFCSTRGKIRRI